jgi:ribonuclease BN (tRNA processing enzyme)
VKVTVLGGCGAWPAAGQACSGYLVEHEGFRLLLDPGYATLPQLLKDTAAEQVDAVLASHGHPDHCADLNPLLRARALGEVPPPALPVHTLPGAMDAVLALDDPRLLAAYTGDTGPSPDIVTMARDADILLAEATVPDHGLRARDAPYLSTARQAGEYGARADAKRLVLTHLWPGTDPSAARAAARRAYPADPSIAKPGLTIDLG